MLAGCKLRLCPGALPRPPKALTVTTSVRRSGWSAAERVRSLRGSQAVIDDYVFEPCGYSMNGILGGGFMTIHITPEAGFSYASVELSGFSEASFDPRLLLAQITRIFRPGKMSVAMTVDLASKSGCYSWGALAAAPAGYGCQGATCQELACGGRVSYFTFAASPGLGGGAAANGAKAGCGVKTGRIKCGPPVALLPHMPSFGSLSGQSSDSDDTSEDIQDGPMPKRARCASSEELSCPLV